MSQEPARKPKANHLPFYIITTLILVGGAFLLLSVNGAFRPRSRVAMVTSTEGSYWDLVLAGANSAAADLDVELVTIRSKPDVASQSKIIRDLFDKGFDGIAISPVNPGEQEMLLKEAAAKARLVTFDSDAPNSNRIAFVGVNNYEAGANCGDQVRQAIPDGGEVVICVGTLDKLNGKERRRALIDNLLDRHLDRNRPDDPVEGELKGDQYTIAATLIDNGDFDKAVQLAGDAIKSRPNLKCFVGLFGYNTPALLKALEQAGKTGQIKVVGFDEADELQAGIENGTVFSSILQNQRMCGYETVRVLVAEVKGESPLAALGTKALVVPSLVLNKETIDSLRAEQRVREPGKK